jgi:hypothetical protein
MANHQKSAPSATTYPHTKYQTFPVHPPQRPPRVTKYFKLFPYLHEELKLTILSFVADAPFETMPENYPKSALTNELPSVSRQFRSICNSDVLWKDALIRITKKEPELWKAALRTMCKEQQPPQQQPQNPDDGDEESILNLVERTHRHQQFLRANCGLRQRLKNIRHNNNQHHSSYYKSIYEHVVNQHLRFKGPVFYMPGQVALGQTYALHLFEYRYRLLIAEAMQFQTPEARNGGPLQHPPVYFIHANRAPLERSVPAVLVQVLQCHIFADGRADVLLLPVKYVWIEKVWVRPDSGHLLYAQCLKMGTAVTSQMNHLQRQEALANVMDRLAGHLTESGGGEDTTTGGGGGVDTSSSSNSSSPPDYTTTTTDGDDDDDDDELQNYSSVADDVSEKSSADYNFNEELSADDSGDDLESDADLSSSEDEDE